jgi:hypothetical protein
MDWVAVSVDLTDDPKVAGFAKALGIELDSAVARLLALWGRMARHENVDGNLAEVPDDVLERWAGWRGKAGRFAEEFRRRFTRDDVVIGWVEWNGRHIARAVAERERWRNRQGPGGDSGGASTGDSIGGSTGGLRGTSTSTGTRTATKATTTTRAPDPAQAEAIAGRLPERYRPAFEGLLRATRHPAAFLAELRALHDAVPGHGPGYSWEVIGHALADMQLAGAPITARAIRRFCEDLVTGTSAATAQPGENEAEAALRRLRAQEARPA